jgi:hypothetical protein
MNSAFVAFIALNVAIHLNAGFSFELEMGYNTPVALYSAPWVRIGPYIMGTLTAIFLHETLKTAKVSD